MAFRLSRIPYIDSDQLKMDETSFSPLIHPKPFPRLEEVDGKAKFAPGTVSPPRSRLNTAESNMRPRLANGPNREMLEREDDIERDQRRVL